MYKTAMLTKDMVAASSKPLLLSILAEGESYGYEIIQKVRELCGGQIEWSDGMLYPVLHRLERDGLIESEWKEADTGRERKYYFISSDGTQSPQNRTPAMADRSQHPVQIMENQTRFDLNAAIENWRQRTGRATESHVRRPARTGNAPARRHRRIPATRLERRRIFLARAPPRRPAATARRGICES